ncbi:hypothetical protein CR203_08505 [Salipaludibacillus neizhouensis]|uniref:Uncharacterized protein n=1 Tax=Salipaludibacillus neizhouensis TaxID=885475 RepID=A0A3A9K2M0_9BACI|nr:CBO0543 family protein [Salipaludibacillus neizhouensis]RKL67394.1 hypothetical protein CR203_08505 [Salipaludibacillus neizhouensis]
MFNHKFEKNLLSAIFIINLILLIPIITRKKPIKVWILLYIYNAATNVLKDKFVVNRKIVKYPVRIFPNVFKIHVLFDLFVYPTITVLFNQMTMKDKPLGILVKLFSFIIPMIVVEYWAVRKTNLITWSKGWKLSHTFLGLTLATLHSRVLLGFLKRKLWRNEEWG